MMINRRKILTYLSVGGVFIGAPFSVLAKSQAISSSLNSTNPDRVSSVYESVLELATIEKALELNRYFQIQVQENLLSTILKETQKGGTRSESDEELKK